MSDKPAESALPYWLLPVFSWAVSLYFCICLIHEVGFLLDEAHFVTHSLVLFLFLFFLFLPFFTKVKIGKLLEIEREAKKTQEEVREFKADVRNSLSVISTNVNTISGFSNQLTVNLPNPSEIREVRKEVESNSLEQLTKEEKQDDLEQVFQREDPTLALAWTRIEIERLLRRILEKSTIALNPQWEEMKYANLSRQFSSFTSLYPNYRYLNEAFRYVTQVCNAAIHAQSVSEDQAREALGLGGQVINILKNILGERGIQPQGPSGEIGTD